MKKLLFTFGVMASTLTFATEAKSFLFENVNTTETSYNEEMGTITKISDGLFSNKYRLDGPTWGPLYIWINGTNSWETVEAGSTFEVPKIFFNMDIMDNQEVNGFSIIYYTSYPNTKVYASYY